MVSLPHPRRPPESYFPSLPLLKCPFPASDGNTDFLAFIYAVAESGVIKPCIFVKFISATDFASSPMLCECWLLLLSLNGCGPFLAKP